MLGKNITKRNIEICLDKKICMNLGKRTGGGERDWKQLRLLWRKVVFKQILLSRMEKEARRRRGGYLFWYLKRWVFILVFQEVGIYFILFSQWCIKNCRDFLPLGI